MGEAIVEILMLWLFFGSITVPVELLLLLIVLVKYEERYHGTENVKEKS